MMRFLWIISYSDKHPFNKVWEIFSLNSKYDIAIKWWKKWSRNFAKLIKQFKDWNMDEKSLDEIISKIEDRIELKEKKGESFIDIMKYYLSNSIGSNKENILDVCGFIWKNWSWKSRLSQSITSVWSYYNSKWILRIWDDIFYAYWWFVLQVFLVNNKIKLLVRKKHLDNIDNYIRYFYDSCSLLDWWTWITSKNILESWKKNYSKKILRDIFDQNNLHIINNVLSNKYDVLLLEASFNFNLHKSWYYFRHSDVYEFFYNWKQNDELSSVDVDKTILDYSNFFISEYLRKFDKSQYKKYSSYLPLANSYREIEKVIWNISKADLINWIVRNIQFLVHSMNIWNKANFKSSNFDKKKFVHNQIKYFLYLDVSFDLWFSKFQEKSFLKELERMKDSIKNLSTDIDLDELYSYLLEFKNKVNYILNLLHCIDTKDLKELSQLQAESKHLFSFDIDIPKKNDKKFPEKILDQFLHMVAYFNWRHYSYFLLSNDYYSEKWKWWEAQELRVNICEYLWKSLHLPEKLEFEKKEYLIWNWIRFGKEEKDLINLELFRDLESFDVKFPINLKLEFKKEWSSISRDNLSSWEKTLLTRNAYLINEVDTYLSLWKWKNCLIVIDEPDLHLHIEWQKRYVALLVDIFSSDKYKWVSFTFFLATHSPYIISDLPDNSVYYLEDGSISTQDYGTFLQNTPKIINSWFDVRQHFSDFWIEAMNNASPEVRARLISDPFLRKYFSLVDELDATDW